MQIYNICVMYLTLKKKKAPDYKKKSEANPLLYFVIPHIKTRDKWDYPD